MHRWLVTAVLLIGLCLGGALGCHHRDTPKFNPLMGMGSTRVAPPATGSYQVPVATAPSSSSYPQPAAGATAAANPNHWRVGSPLPVQYQHVPGAHALHPTSYQVANLNTSGLALSPNNMVQSQVITTLQGGGATGFASQASGVTSGDRFAQGGAMPVNDATNSNVPARFAADGQWAPMNIPGTRTIQGNWEFVSRPQSTSPMPVQGRAAVASWPAGPMPANTVMAQSSTAPQYNQAGGPSGWYDRNSGSLPYNR